jgi:hypothetical protein
MITAADWEAFLDDLQQTPDKFAVPQAENLQRSDLLISFQLTHQYLLDIGGH